MRLHELEARVAAAGQAVDAYLDEHDGGSIDPAELDALAAEHRTAVAALDARRAVSDARAELSSEPAAAVASDVGARGASDDFSRYLRTGERRTQTAGTAAAGGYLVPDTFVAELVGEIESASPFISALRMLPAISSTGSVTYPTLATDIPAIATLSELATAAKQDLAFGEVELTPTRYAVQTEISRQLLITAGYPIEALLRERYAEAISRRLEALAIAQLAAPTSNRTDVTTSGAVAWADFVSTYLALPPNYRRRGSWVLSDDVVEAVAEAVIGTADNRPVATMGNSWRDGVADQLVGRPAFESELITGTLSTVSDVAYFADLASILVQPFGGVDLVRDDVTAAGTGRVIFTLNVFYGIARTDDNLISALRGKA